MPLRRQKISLFRHLVAQSFFLKYHLLCSGLINLLLILNCVFMFTFTTRTFLTNRKFAIFAVSSARVFLVPRTNGGGGRYIYFPIRFNVVLATVKGMTFCTAFTQYQQARFTIFCGHAVTNTATNHSFRHYNFLQ